MKDPQIISLDELAERLTLRLEQLRDRAAEFKFTDKRRFWQIQTEINAVERRLFLAKQRRGVA